MLLAFELVIFSVLYATSCTYRIGMTGLSRLQFFIFVLLCESYIFLVVFTGLETVLL